MNYPDSIYKLSEKLHWMKISEDGVLEFYLDNHMLQTFRMCEANFFESFVEGYRSTGGRIWFLDFGTCVHEVIEYYYKNYKKPEFNWEWWSIQYTKQVWMQHEMDYYADTNGQWYKEYTSLGGYPGFAGMMVQYASIFRAENDRFRVIGAELYFGKNKEVPLENEKFIDGTINFHFPFRLYLAGKIDLLMDDGFNIGPMDHKTAKDFRGQNPARNYEIQEGMTGYVFAARKILKNFMGELGSNSSWMKELAIRQCNKIWMNFLQVKPEADINKRFKRIPIYKSDWELEEYRQRQISTVARLYQLLENYREDRTGLRPHFNTMACTNWMHQICPYQSAHHQKDNESMLRILNVDFVKDQSKIWDWSNVDQKETVNGGVE